MMASVEFDCESRFGAREVRDEGSDRELSAEMKLFEPICSEPAPQLLFRIRLIAAKLASAMVSKGDGSNVRLHCGILRVLRALASNLSRRDRKRADLSSDKERRRSAEQRFERKTLTAAGSGGFRGSALVLGGSGRLRHHRRYDGRTTPSSSWSCRPLGDLRARPGDP
jgi:hypothetical protein